jgi:hypothetical protein
MTYLNEIERECIFYGFIIPIVVGLQYLTLAIYNGLFGLLYRRVSQEYAEPVSFYVALSLPLSITGWIVYLYIKLCVT